jgi:hypothetical protein
MSKMPTISRGNRGALSDVITNPEKFRLLKEYAELLASSSFVPKDYIKQAGNIIIAIQMGDEVGLPPLQALQNISSINGRPSVWGDAALALCQSSAQYESVTETFDEATMTATCIAKRRGEPNAVVRTFSIEDAKQAKLWNKPGPWSDYPKQMLRMRARSFALRTAFADVLKGIAIAEEQADVVTNSAPPPFVAESIQVPTDKGLSGIAQAAAFIDVPVEVVELKETGADKAPTADIEKDAIEIFGEPKAANATEQIQSDDASTSPVPEWLAKKLAALGLDMSLAKNSKGVLWGNVPITPESQAVEEILLSKGFTKNAKGYVINITNLKGNLF